MFLSLLLVFMVAITVYANYLVLFFCFHKTTQSHSCWMNRINSGGNNSLVPLYVLLFPLTFGDMNI